MVAAIRTEGLAKRRGEDDDDPVPRRHAGAGIRYPAKGHGFQAHRADWASKITDIACVVLVLTHFGHSYIK